MKDGALILSFEDGHVTGVAVAAGLYEHYRRLFEAAEADLVDDNVTTETAIRIVVFGCMWIEAIANSYLRDVLLATSRTPGMVDALWRALDRSSIRHKLSTLAASAQPSVEVAAFEPVEGLFQLRNSLVHFRDRHEGIEWATTSGTLDEQVAQLPEPELIHRLKRLAVGNAKAVRAAVDCLESVRSFHVPGKRLSFAPGTTLGSPAQPYKPLRPTSGAVASEPNEQP